MKVPPRHDSPLITAVIYKHFNSALIWENEKFHSVNTFSIGPGNNECVLHCII
jgi:hypothetical protein